VQHNEKVTRNDLVRVGVYLRQLLLDVRTS